MSPLRELVPQLIVVVDLAVQDEDRPAVLAHEGLRSPLGIDDGEAAVGESGAVAEVHAVVVWPPVMQCLSHAVEDGVGIEWAGAEAQESGYAAHGITTGR